MKPLSILLILSLSANAMLVMAWWCLRGPGITPRSETASVAASLGSDANVTRVGSIAVGASWQREISAAIASGDLAAVRRLMAATGLPEGVARALLRSLIHRPYEQRRHEIYAAKLAANPRFWSRLPGFDGLSHAERAELRALLQSTRERGAIMAAPDEATSAFDAQRCDFLPADKAARLKAIDRDYAEMLRDLQQEISRFRTPEDEEQWRLLIAERERDLAALLTPDERRLYDLHNSETAQRLRSRFGCFNATEDEFGRIYALQRSFDEKYERSAFDIMTRPGYQPSVESNSERREAQKRLDADIRRELGDARYAELQRSQTLDYRQLQAAGERFGVAAASLDLAWAAREKALAASTQLAASGGMDGRDRATALANVAGQARSAVVAALGEQVGGAYLRNAMGWLKTLDRGTPVTASVANESGMVVTTISISGGTMMTSIRTSSAPAGAQPPQQGKK